ncbi:MAG: hypothetical protein KDK50_00255 [Chlamydiia bacterium]|nr:hypothetical protein [Chlamydiia bacterium]
MAKKSRVFCSFIFIFGAGLCGLLFFLSIPSLPKSDELFFYSDQTGDDLKLLMCYALKNAKKNIDVMTFGLSDPDVIRILENQAAKGCSIRAIADQRSTPKHPLVERRKKSGLNHAKVTLIDDELALIGSANSTTASLEMHHNFILATRSRSLCKLLKEACFDKALRGQYEVDGLEIWLTPDKNCENRLIELIDGAEHCIQLVLFTFTHKGLISALERAKDRGVQVDLVTDRYSKQPAIAHRVGIGPALIHHKWALIDDETLICGSANWTNAAFTKNRDIILIIKNLSLKQKLFCKRLWKTLDLE